MGKIIELVLDVESVRPTEAVLPSEAEGPTIFEITPIEVRSPLGKSASAEIRFRVAFEPDNSERRIQPYRETVTPKFPNGWKYGDSYDPANLVYPPENLMTS